MTARISLLNDVLGPVMRGPSSSHTAGPFFIGRAARAMLGDEPVEADFSFDPGGSFAQVYRRQGSDLGFAAGVMGWEMADERFPNVMAAAGASGPRLSFRIEPSAEATHPNTVVLRLRSASGRVLNAVAQSVGGGAIRFTRVEQWSVQLGGDAHELLVEAAPSALNAAREIAAGDGAAIGAPEVQRGRDAVLLRVRRRAPLGPEARSRLGALSGVRRVWAAPPVGLPVVAEPSLRNAADLMARAAAGGKSLGGAALDYEAALLDLPAREVLEKAGERLDVMRRAVGRGLEEGLPPMQLLKPSARILFNAEGAGGTAVGGLHARAAARALAVMEVNSAHGLVCAAPTAGSAGVIPGVLVTLIEEKGLPRDKAVRSLLAAAAVGLVVANRATFAAEVAGCQVEVSAAGAMAAACVVEAAGGDARHACAAAALFFQNTMGLICDPVQGLVEIPCHGRNAVAASSAFICADMVLGGWSNPIPLDETVDAVLAVGRMLPRELRCTALGGLAATPSGMAFRCPAQ